MSPATLPRWESLQEIVPAIERLWMTSLGHEAQIARLSRESLGKCLAMAMEADSIVLTFLCDAALDFVRRARQLRLHAPLLLHLHGEATFPGLRLSTIDSALDERDEFVVACRADAAALRLAYPRARVHVEPFPLLPAPRRRRARAVQKPRKILVAAGRISEQKNLHVLLSALALSAARNDASVSALNVYGWPDGYGSPKMGVDGIDYLDLLRSLAHELGVEKRVNWRGRISRGQMKRQLAHPGLVFVSASLHADENFGAAAHDALSAGAHAVLSDWGGHRDLALAFPGRVRLVPVYGHRHGPFLSPLEFARAIDQAVTDSGARCEQPRKFQRKPKRPENPHERLRKLVLAARLRAQTLGPLPAKGLLRSSLPTRLLRRVRKRRTERTRIALFRGYDDPLAAPIFFAYGMRPRSTNCPKLPWAPPWVIIGSSTIVIQDPHRGRLRLPRSGKRTLALFDAYGRRHPVSRRELAELWRRGYAF